MKGCSSGGLESTEGCLGVWGHLGGSHKAVERMFGAYLRGGWELWVTGGSLWHLGAGLRQVAWEQKGCL